jgi:phosphohistidine phosphatase SixA
MRFFPKTAALLSAALLAATGAAAQAHQHGGETTVILVRHAEKAAAAPGAMMTADPPLSPAGEQRARDLAALLRDRHVDAILTTQFERTKMTGRPLAEALHLTAEETPAGGDAAAHAAAVAEMIRTRVAGKTVLVVGHSNTVPKIIAALGGPALADICDAAYSNIFTLVIPTSGTARLEHAHYGAADPPSDGCADGLRADAPKAR